MKFSHILLLALVICAQSQFLRRSVEETVNTDVSLDDVNTVVNNVNTVAGMNQSGIVVLNNVNFGVIVQQIGEFAVTALDLARIMEPALHANSQSDVDTDVSMRDINTVVNNINTAFGMNQSGVVVLKASNFGVILQQIGEFQTQTKLALKKLKAAEESDESETVNTNVDLDGVNTVVNNIDTAAGINQSGIVSVSNTNWGIIVQQIGRFATQTAKTISEAADPENNQNEYVDTRIELSDIATVVNNINTAGGMNQSGIVVLDDVNFGVVVQQIGEFDTESLVSESKKAGKKLSEGQVEEVNVEVDLSEIDTVVNNINSAFGMNQSGIVVLNNVNFGVIVQQIGEFETSLKELAQKAEILKEQHQSKANSFFKKLIQ